MTACMLKTVTGEVGGGESLLSIGLTLFVGSQRLA